MKKVLIGMLITCSLGLVSCGKGNTENPSTNNNSGMGVTDGTNSTGVTDGTDGTNPNSNNTNPNPSSNNAPGVTMNENKTSVNNLYTELKGKVEGGIDNISNEDWNNYRTQFTNEINNLRKTNTDSSLNGTLDDIQNLFNEYDTAIKNKTNLDNDKVKEMKDKIENELK